DVGAWHPELAPGEVEILIVVLHHMSGDLLGFRYDASGANVDARASDRHGSRVERPVPGLNLPRISLNDLYVLHRHLQHIGSDLCERGRVTMALALGARVERDLAA